MKRLFLLGSFLVILFSGIFSSALHAEALWTGMLLVDKSNSLHAEAAPEKPALSFPIVIHVEESSQAFKAGIRPGDYIAEVNGKAVKTAQEAEAALEKGKSQVQVHSAIGLKTLEIEPSPVTPEVMGYLKIRSFLRINKVREGKDDIQRLANEFPHSLIVNFMGAFAFGSIKEREKANELLVKTARLDPDMLLAKLCRNRLPKDLQEQMVRELAAPATSDTHSPPAGDPGVSTAPLTPPLEPSVVTLASGTPGDFGDKTGSEAAGISDQFKSDTFDSQAFNKAALDEKLEMLRTELGRKRDDVMLRKALAFFLVKKVTSLARGPYEDIEPLLREALEVAPDPSGVEYCWGDILYAKKNYEAAIPHLEAATGLKPENMDIAMKLGLSYFACMKYEECIPHFERARKGMPNEFAVLYYLGVAYLEIKDYDHAVEVLEEAMKIAKTASQKQAVTEAIRRAKEHGASSEGATKEENSRFIVQFAGDSQKDLGDNVMDMLEEAYDQVTGDLMYKPDIKINVLFFRTEDFYKQGKMPQWAGAVAQGEKILVPLSEGYRGIEYVKGILAHEFTHVIINLKTNNRCPTWIHEGLAVYQQNKIEYGDPNTLRPDYERVFREVIQVEKKLFPLHQITLDHRTQQANISLGYVQSFLAIRFLVEKWGFSGIDEMLTTLGQGGHLENAIEAGTGRDLAQFQTEFFDWIGGVQ
jgi:tetratricopeptide (TPR) repeat protein